MNSEALGVSIQDNIAVVEEEECVTDTACPELSADSLNDNSGVTFTKEQNELFQKRFEEGFDVFDAEYSRWVCIKHPELTTDSVVDLFQHVAPQNPVQLMDDATPCCSKQVVPSQTNQTLL